MGKEAYNLILGPNFVTKQGPKELGGNAWLPLGGSVL